MSLKTEKLHKQEEKLQEEKGKKKSGEKIEVIFMWIPCLPTLYRLENCYPLKNEIGNIWGSPCHSESGEDDSLFPLNPPEYETRLIIETEEASGPWDKVGNYTPNWSHLI